jgi:hypothetical protein
MQLTTLTIYKKAREKITLLTPMIPEELELKYQTGEL